MAPRTHLAASLAIAIALSVAPHVRGDDAVPLPPPPPGTRQVNRAQPGAAAGSFQLTPPGAAPVPAPAAAPPLIVPAAPAPAPAAVAAPRPAVRWAITTGFDYGFNKLVKVEMTDGSTQSLAANDGLFLSVGATFLPLLEGRLETQATLGIKGWSIDASNGSMSITMFPIEILEAFRAEPLRLSAGVVFVPGPTTSAHGALASLNGIEFDNSLGIVLQGEWVAPFKNGRGQLSIGPRFLIQKFQVAHGGPVLGANALGFVASVAFR